MNISSKRIQPSDYYLGALNTKENGVLSIPYILPYGVKNGIYKQCYRFHPVTGNNMTRKSYVLLYIWRSVKLKNHENIPRGIFVFLFFSFFVIIAFQQIFHTIFACTYQLDMVDGIFHLQRQLRISLLINFNWYWLILVILTFKYQMF